MAYSTLHLTLVLPILIFTFRRTVNEGLLSDIVAQVCWAIYHSDFGCFTLFTFAHWRDTNFEGFAWEF